MLVRRLIDRLLLLGLVAHALADCRHADRDALWRLYELTNGAQWTLNTNWRRFGDPCAANERWVGVGVHDPCKRYYDDQHGPCTLGRVASLALDSNNLVGNISSWHQLGQMANLTLLELPWNALEGTLPTQIGDIQNLVSINLHHNNLTGAVPTEIGTINWLRGDSVELREITLYANSLSGALPTELGNHKGMEALNVEDNSLTGQIPTQLATLSSLVALDLDRNPMLSGTLPADVSRMREMRYLEARECQISGTIPESLGELRLMTIVNLSGNKLSGSLPTSLANLYQLRDLKIADNHLSGNLPPEVGRMSALEWIDLYNNSMQGDLPSTIADLEDLKYMYLDKELLLPIRKKYCGQRLPDLKKYNWVMIREEYRYHNMMSSYCPDDELLSAHVTWSTLQDSGLYET